MTFKGISISFLVLTIACWFITLVLTLTIEGIGFTETSVIRYDLVFFNALIPTLAAIAVFAAFFWGKALSLLITLQKALITLYFFIKNLLLLLFSKIPAPATVDSGISLKLPYGTTRPEQSQLGREVSVWVFLPFLILILGLIIPHIPKLIKLLKTKLNPSVTIPGSPPFSKTLLQLCKWLLKLVWIMFRTTINLILLFNSLAAVLQKKIKKILYQWLPAKNPYEKILRSYESFLRLGHKSGCSRRSSETPLEYARRMEEITGNELFPNEEVNRLTSLFLEARYNKNTLNWQQGADSQVLFKTIKNRFRNK